MKIGHINKTFLFSALLISFFAFGPMSRAAGEEVNLGPRFTPGASRAYTYKMQVLGRMDVKGVPDSGAPASLDITMSLEFDVKQNVVSVDAKETHLKLDFGAARFKINIPGIVDFSYDSTKDADKGGPGIWGKEPGGKFGGSIDVYLTPDGKMTRLNELYGKLDKLFGYPGGGQQNPVPLGSFEYLEILKAAFLLLYDFASGGSAAPGDTWQTEVKLELPQVGSARWKNSYAYSGRELYLNRMCAKIKLKADNKLDKPLDMDAKGMKIEKFSAPPAQGTIYFDPKAGELVGFDYRQDVFLLFGVDAPSAPNASKPRTTMQLKLIIDYTLVK